MNRVLWRQTIDPRYRHIGLDVLPSCRGRRGILTNMNSWGLEIQGDFVVVKVDVDANTVVLRALILLSKFSIVTNLDARTAINLKGRGRIVSCILVTFARLNGGGNESEKGEGECNFHFCKQLRGAYGHAFYIRFGTSWSHSNPGSGWALRSHLPIVDGWWRVKKHPECWHMANWATQAIALFRRNGLGGRERSDIYTVIILTQNNDFNMFALLC